MSQLLSAWAWLKKNWKWLLLPIGVAAWFLGRASAKKTIVVTSPELTAHDEFRAGVEAETREKLEQAESERRQAHVRIEVQKDERLHELDAEAERKTAELQQDPEAINDFLKKVGKSVRNRNQS